MNVQLNGIIHLHVVKTWRVLKWYYYYEYKSYDKKEHIYMGHRRTQWSHMPRFPVKHQMTSRYGR